MRAAACRLVHEQRNLPRFAVDAVECRKLREARRHELGGIHRPGFASGPSLQAIAGDVQHIGVVRLIRGRKSEGQAVALDVETQ